MGRHEMPLQTLTSDALVISTLLAFLIIGSPFPVRTLIARDFDEALKDARDSVFDHRDAASAQRKINLYSSVIAEFPSHPRVNDAKLNLFWMLESSGEDSAMESAGKLISEILETSADETADGELIAFEYLEFHLENLPGRLRKAADVKKAKTVARDLADAALRRQDIPTYVRAVRYAALAIAQQGDHNQAVKLLMESLGRCEHWRSSGELERLRRTSLIDYIRVNAGVENLTQAVASLTVRTDAQGFSQTDQKVVAEIQLELANRPEIKFQSMQNVERSLDAVAPERPKSDLARRSTIIALNIALLLAIGVGFALWKRLRSRP
jgi:hypothetical protein